MSNRITCITKPDRHNPHRRITHVGGVNTSGQYFKITEEEAIAGIESGRYQFHVTEGGRTVSVVVENRLGSKYLKTHPDGTPIDNLLSLKECA